MASIYSVRPTQISSLDNVKLSIIGDGFAKASAIYFLDSSSSTKVFARSFTIVGDTQIDTVIPSLSPGRLKVFVIIGGEEATVVEGPFRSEGMANLIFYTDGVRTQ